MLLEEGHGIKSVAMLKTDFISSGLKRLQSGKIQGKTEGNQGGKSVMKKPQNRFIEEIEKDSAGSFAGSSENRSSGAGVAEKNDSSRKCGACRDGSSCK